MKRSLLGLLAALVLGVTVVGSGPAVASTDSSQVTVSQVQPADHDDDKDKDKDDGKEKDDGKDKGEGKDKDKDRDKHGDKDRDKDGDRGGEYECIGLIVICIG